MAKVRLQDGSIYDDETGVLTDTAGNRLDTPAEDRPVPAMRSESPRLPVMPSQARAIPRDTYGLDEFRRVAEAHRLRGGRGAVEQIGIEKARPFREAGRAIRDWWRGPSETAVAAAERRLTPSAIGPYRDEYRGLATPAVAIPGGAIPSDQLAERGVTMPSEIPIVPGRRPLDSNAFRATGPAGSVTGTTIPERFMPGQGTAEDVIAGLAGGRRRMPIGALGPTFINAGTEASREATRNRILDMGNLKNVYSFASPRERKVMDRILAEPQMREQREFGAGQEALNRQRDIDVAKAEAGGVVGAAEATARGVAGKTQAEMDRARMEAQGRINEIRTSQQGQLQLERVRQQDKAAGRTIEQSNALNTTAWNIAQAMLEQGTIQGTGKDKDKNPVVTAEDIAGLFGAIRNSLAGGSEVQQGGGAESPGDVNADGVVDEVDSAMRFMQRFDKLATSDARRTETAKQYEEAKIKVDAWRKRKREEEARKQPAA